MKQIGDFCDETRFRSFIRGAIYVNTRDSDYFVIRHRNKYRAIVCETCRGNITRENVHRVIVASDYDTLSAAIDEVVEQYFIDTEFSFR